MGLKALPRCQMAFVGRRIKCGVAAASRGAKRRSRDRMRRREFWYGPFRRFVACSDSSGLGVRSRRSKGIAWTAIALAVIVAT
jgi:hypothetical protein